LRQKDPEPKDRLTGGAAQWLAQGDTAHCDMIAVITKCGRPGCSNICGHLQSIGFNAAVHALL
jgi:hypothetical protein